MRWMFSCLLAVGMMIATASELRIMPMGDSITYGSQSPTTSGYRGPLYTMLTNAGYTVRYVGTDTKFPDALPAGQQNHEGHSGWIIKNTGTSRKGMWDYLPTAFDQILGPHLVLLHIGTNDASDSSDFTTVLDRLDALIDRVSEMQPSADIIVTTLLQRTDNATAESKIVTYYNPYLQDRVASHVAKGQKVHFYDMRPKVSAATELYDKLHPNATGYTHMAEGWLEAIQGIVKPASDYPEVKPAVVGHTYVGNTTTGTMTLRLNVPTTSASAADLTHYTLAPAGTVASATLSSDSRTVTLAFTGMTEGTDTTLTVQGLSNEPGNDSLASTVYTFRTEEDVQPGVAGKVDELSKYELVYDLNILSKGAVYNTDAVNYAVDNRLKVGKFSRVAYYMELQQSGGVVKYVWASMDAFTDDVNKIGVPTAKSGADFRVRVSNLKIYSNVDGVPTGVRPDGGNIEFFPYNYDGARTLGIATATSAYDNDDSHSRQGNYGSMQVHDIATGTTLFAYNLWGGKDGADAAQDLGLGNNPSGNRDWTRAGNSAGYTLRHLQVYVMPDVADVVAPTLSTAEIAANGVVVLTFSKPMAATGLLPCFSLSKGTVMSVTRRADNPRILELTVSGLKADSTLTIDGLRDASPRGNLLAKTTTSLAATEVPAAVTSRVASTVTSGYTLVYSIDIPINNPGWTSGNAGKEIYTVDRTPILKDFDRVAYFLELETADGKSQYVWTSFKAFTSNVDYVGVPLKRYGKLWDVLAEDMEVASNVSGVTTGTGLSGSLEFGYAQYAATADSGYAGASSSNYDFDDELRTTSDYGCMQVHNLTDKKTVWAFNRWGRTGSYCELGIGQNSSGHPDYTTAENGHIYTKRVLHVFVRPVASPADMPARILTNVSEAKDYEVVYLQNLPVTGTGGDATAYAQMFELNRGEKSRKFDRQAYYLELVSNTTPATTNWVWTSFDAVTAERSKLTFPVKSTDDWTFWQKVTKLNVFSNVSGVTTGTEIATGNIEFTSKNFSAENQLGLSGGSANDYDFADKVATSGDHACMQVHNYGAKQTVWAVNRFYRSGNLCMGIGNSPTGYPDWTNVATAQNYSERRLFVLVRPDDGAKVNQSATPRRVVAAQSRQWLCVSFTSALAEDVAKLFEGCALSGTSSKIVNVMPSESEPRDVLLRLDQPLAADSAFTLTVNGKSLSFRTMKAVTPSVLDPKKITEVADYQLVNVLPLPNSACYSHYGADYLLDESRFNAGVAFDRVAYCLELEKNGVRQWVWTAFDALESNVAKIGLPSAERWIMQWGEVTNLEVSGESSDGTFPCTTGSFAKGRIEFCFTNYSQTRSAGYENASNSAFDFDDTYSNTSPLAAGCGSMQVHNPVQGETVFSVSSFGNTAVNTARTLSIGIGNNPNAAANSDPDWTYAKNAADYSVKNLYVLVRPAAVAESEDHAFLLQPKDGSMNATYRPQLTLSACALGAVGYQWRLNGQNISMANSSALTLTFATAKAGSYDVVATFADGTKKVSNAAAVTLVPKGLIFVLR